LSVKSETSQLDRAFMKPKCCKKVKCYLQNSTRFSSKIMENGILIGAENRSLNIQNTISLFVKQ
jgi:hypothetical protein